MNIASRYSNGLRKWCPMNYHCTIEKKVTTSAIAHKYMATQALHALALIKADENELSSELLRLLLIDSISTSIIANPEKKSKEQRTMPTTENQLS